MTIKQAFIAWYEECNGHSPDLSHGPTQDEWLAFVSGYGIGQAFKVRQMQSEAIKHGAAYYHPETGEFTWKGEE